MHTSGPSESASTIGRMTTVLDVHVRLREAEDRLRQTENLISAAGVLHEAGISADSPDCQRLFREIVRLPDEGVVARACAPRGGFSPYRRDTQILHRRSTRAARQGRQGQGLTGATRSATPRTSKTRWPTSSARTVGPEDKAHIIKRAREVPRGTDVLPDDSVPVPSGETAVIDVEEFTVKLWRFSTRT